MTGILETSGVVSNQEESVLSPVFLRMAGRAKGYRSSTGVTFSTQLPMRSELDRRLLFLCIGGLHLKAYWKNCGDPRPCRRDYLLSFGVQVMPPSFVSKLCL